MGIRPRGELEELPRRTPAAKKESPRALSADPWCAREAPHRHCPLRRRNGAATLTEAQLAKLTSALEAARDGDFSVRLRADGALAEVAAAFNTLVERNQQVTRELVRVSKVVGREGRITERAGVAGAPGSWADKVGAVNELIDNLARPTIEVARVIDAVADGDLRQRIQLEIDGQPVRGEFRRIGTTVNAMVDQLSSFADEVTRVAREVGTEGKLGGQARVKGVSGTWKDLTDSVNQMASNLTGQVRNIADVTTAVANGDLSKKVTVDVKGEVLELKNTVNTMVDQLSSFADEVTRVAREVGTDGNLGGQAQVEGRLGRLEGPDREREHARRQPHLPGAQHRRRHDRGRERRPLQEDHRRRQGRGARAEGDHQHDGRPAALVLGRGDARREGGRHRGQARRPGPGRGRLGRLEGPDREREHARRQPHRPGAEHRRRDDRGRERRPLEEDHRRRQGRGPRGEGDRQHDGRPAALVRRRGHARRPRGRHRGPPRRPGPGRGRLRRLEGPDRQRQHARRQPHLPGAATSPPSRPRSRTATSPRRSPSTSRARCSSSRTRSTRWSTSSRASPPRSPASPARSAPKGSSAARLR